LSSASEVVGADAVAVIPTLATVAGAAASKIVRRAIVTRVLKKVAV